MTTSKEVVSKNKITKRKKRNRITLIIIILLFLILLMGMLWKRNTIVKYFLENHLGEIVKADISLNSIEINNKGIYFEDLKLESKSDIYYYLDTAKLDINLSYSALVNHKKWLSEAVDSLYIESPTMAYGQKFGNEDKSNNNTIKKKTSNTEKTASSTFDIRNYIRKATITNAKLSAEVQYSKYFGINDSFSSANITFDNKREATVIADMYDNQMNPIQAKLSLIETGLNYVSLQPNGYNPDSLYVPVVTDIDVELYGNAKLDLSNLKDLHLSMDLISKSSSVNIYDMALEIDNLKIKGDSDNFLVSPEISSFMGIPVKIQGNLINLFDKLEIEAKAQIEKYQIGKTFVFMEGIVTADVEVEGFAENLHITGNVNSDSLDFNSLVVNNIDASLDFQEQFEINLINAELDRNTLAGKGILHKNYVSADLIIKNKDESAITLQGNLKTRGIILDGSSYFRLMVSDFTVGYNEILLPPISGLVSLDEDMLCGELSNEEIAFNFNTNLTFTDSKATIELLDYQAHDSYIALKKESFAKINPLLNGVISIIKNNNDLTGNLDLEITAFNDQVYLPLKADFKWDIASSKIDLSTTIFNGKVFSNKTNMVGEAFVSNFNTLDANIKINDDIIIKGKDLLNKERKARLEINQLASTEIKGFFPKELTTLYPDGYITLNVDYYWSKDFINGDIFFTGIEAFGLAGYGLEGHFKGDLEKILLTKLNVYNERQILVTAYGSLETRDGIVANIDAVVNEIDFTDYQNLIPLKGFLGADLNFRYDSKDEEKYGIRIKGVGSDFKIADFDINDVYFNLLYTSQKIHVDNLYLNSVNYADMNIIGDFSYDLFRNEFVPSNERLYVKLDADIYNLLHKLAPDLFNDGDLALRSELIIGINEEGLQVYEGYVISEKGFLEILDQPERVNNIELLAVMKDNELDLEKCELNLGDGYLRVANIISEDNDNFFVGNLVLGQLRVFTSSRGLLAHIPQYMPKSETALIKIGGRYQKYATVKGPFDDMKIDAEVTVSNASIIYPPNTENLTSIITSASKSTFKKKEKTLKKENISNNPLPFVLDAKLIIGENTKYVTYPTDITLSPNSYLILNYGNNLWSVPDARFVAEEGTVTFLDTEFDVDLVEILINEIDLSVNASFVKKVQDGSTVTLVVSNEQSNQVGLDDLVLTLESDNPEDKTQSQAINRLRVSDNSNELAQEDRNALQNETIRMLGSNVDNTFFNKFLRPAESFFRKRLRLDYFNIKPGFVKNMVNNYVIDNETDQVQTDNAREVTDSELAKFSSSILLNNLTLNFGRPIHKRLYFNYEGFFQETTNLNKESNITYDQDFELRTNIDFKTKMSYTFKYRPSGTSSHEVMLFHSINF